MKNNTLIGLLLIASAFCSCATQSRLSLSCADPTVEIFIDGEYVGRELVSYTFPSGKQTIEVTCYENGQEVYRRTFYKESYKKGELVDIQPRTDFKYSQD